MFVSVVLISAICTFLSVTSLFFVALKLKNNSILDVYWGLGFVVVAIVGLITTQNHALPSILVASFIAVWGLRLSVHIYRRNHNKPEDPRYQMFREKWKHNVALKSYVNLFLLQGVLLQIISLSTLSVMVYRTDALNMLDLAGIVLWGVGFYFEMIGDWQLSQFKQNPENKGKILTHGLWKFTRHPNYFGESLMWWGIWMFTLSTPLGIVMIISPVLLTILLIKVSGVKLLEDRYKGNKDYELYKKNTPAFFPKFF